MDEGRLTDDVRVDLLDLTLDEVDALELVTGRPFYDMAGSISATEMRRLLVAHLSRTQDPAEAEQAVNALTMPELAGVVVDSTENLPVTYEDGVPIYGGRTADRYVVACAEAYHWPPTVTRAQKLRDLRLLGEAAESRPKT